MAFDRNQVRAYIVEAARRRGIDPDTALRVINQESGFNPEATNLSPKEKSYGLMQLNTQGGLGVHALEKGINIRDPSTWRQQVDFGLDVVAKDGWRQWYGARDTGVGRWDGIGGRPAAWKGGKNSSPLVGAVAERQVAGGQGSDRLTGDAGGDTLGTSSPTASTSSTVEIGLSPEQKRKAAGYDAVTESGMRMGQNARNVWDVAGGLAQVWAGTSGARKLEEGEHSELVKAYAARGLTPDEQVIASAKGGREGLADVLAARQVNAQRTAERAEAQAWRQDERDYRRGRDAVEDKRWKAEQDRSAQGTLPAGYRRTETGMEAVPGGPADPAVARADFKPSIQTVYDDQGREQKGYFDQEGKWTTMGGPKAPSNSGGVTISPDGTVQIGGGVKMPANFQPDPANPGAVKPIPGGPGEQLPAEFAGRIGIADSFLGQAPALRERLAGGAVTGPWDRAQAGNNSSSEQAGIFRQLQSGADALQRLLTGAGMTEAEAAIYAERYLPSYTDSAESAVSKLDQMVREIENVRAASLRGRGGAAASVTPNDAPPRAGLVPGSDAGADMPLPNRANGAHLDYRTRYGLE